MRKRSEIGQSVEQPAAGTAPAAERTVERAQVDLAGPARRVAEETVQRSATLPKYADHNRLSEGDTVDVTKGCENYCPVKFNGFDVGPLRMATTIRKGENYLQAYERVSLALEELFELEYQLKLKDFRDRLEKNGDR